MTEKKTRPGKNRHFKTNLFEYKEKRILEHIEREWYLTHSGFRFKLGASFYQGFLMKPIPVFAEMFNLEREIICVFSPYDNFEPRTLEAFSMVQKQYADLRTESICRILISKDKDIEQKIEALIKTDPEQPVIIPFTYNELLTDYDRYFIRNRFVKHFYSRNLFDFLSPLKSELYFFGRSQIIHELVSKHRASEHTGLFGLRKSGKTSIIYAVERRLRAAGDNYLSFDCESPSIHKLRWNELLEKIVVMYHKKVGSKVKVDTEERYVEKFAADSFEGDILKIYRSKKPQSTLFLFDEIERLTPGTASSAHWREEEDFIYFWQTLRAFYQRNPNVFTYMLVGTRGC